MTFTLELGIVLGILTTWRLVLLITTDRVMEWLREIAGIHHNEDGFVVGFEDNWRAELLSCPRCVSVWVALGVLVLWLNLPQVCGLLMLLCALSAGSILVDALWGRLETHG